MKILLVPTTEGFGHVSRAKAIIQACEQKGLDYTILTDEKRAQFLSKNAINYHNINPSFYGISYVYQKKTLERRLNIPLTTGKLLIDTPRYLIDWGKVCRMLYQEKYDILINDINLQLSRFPQKKVVNIMHYKLPAIKDAPMLVRNPQAAFFEGFVEPMINIPFIGSNKFIMDLRKEYLNYHTIFPPIVAHVTKKPKTIRKELGIANNAFFIIDGRPNPPVHLYEKICNDHSDIHFLIRSPIAQSENIINKPFIPHMINYVNAANLFITNPGFTSLGEGAITGTRMLIAHPQNHFEQLKNMWIATLQGYGRPINDLESDILSNVSHHSKQPHLDNGLDYLIKKLFEYAI